MHAQNIICKFHPTSPQVMILKAISANLQHCILGFNRINPDTCLLILDKHSIWKILQPRLHNIKLIPHMFIFKDSSCYFATFNILVPRRGREVASHLFVVVKCLKFNLMRFVINQWITLAWSYRQNFKDRVRREQKLGLTFNLCH